MIEGFDRWLDRVEEKALEESAKQVVEELKVVGPYYSGDFESNWVVLPGEQEISGSVAPGTRPKFQQNRVITTTPIPRPQNNTLTIGNRMEYKLIAQDLLPGRLKEGGGPGSADPDWFTIYTTSQIQNALKKGVTVASQDSSIRNFKGS